MPSTSWQRHFRRKWCRGFSGKTPERNRSHELPLYLSHPCCGGAPGLPCLRRPTEDRSRAPSTERLFGDLARSKGFAGDFKGARDDPVDRLKKLAILRAAEIGQGRRFDRFVIVQTGDQFIIDGVRKSGDDLLPVEKLKVIVVVKFVVKGEPEYEQAFDIRGKIEEIKKESATKRIEGSNGGR
jgi:hypothetical protein